MASFHPIENDSSSRLSRVGDTSSCTVKCGSLTVAIGVIVLIGSLVAAGCLYTQLGYYSCAIGGGGVAALILSIVLKKYCLPEELTTVDTPSNTYTSPVIVETVPDINPTPFRGIPRNLTPLFNQVSSASSASSGSDDEESTTVQNFVSVFDNVSSDSSSSSGSDDETPIIVRATPTLGGVLTPSVATPPKPPLPFIFSMDLDATHPLQSPMGLALFMKRSPGSGAMLFALSFGGGASLDDIFGSSISYDEIVNIPLGYWLEDPYALYSTIKNDPDRQHLRLMIDERIEALDAAMQLKERLARLNYPRLTVKDLFPAWKDSTLPLKLMQEDEIRSLNVASLDTKDVQFQQNRGFLTFLKEHAPKRTGFAVPPHSTPEEMKVVPLIDLPRFTAGQINIYPPLFPPLTFCVIPESELAQVDITKLTTPQLELIFSVDRLLHLFKPAQVNACVPRIQNKALLANCNEEQILGFDEAQLNQDSFDILYTVRGDFQSNAAKYLPKKDLQWIYAHQSWFSDAHWEYVGKEHDLAIDLDKIDASKRKLVFKNCYSTYSGKDSLAHQRLPKESLQWIYDHQSWFTDDHWEHIGQAHAVAIDLGNIEQTKRKTVFEEVYSSFGHPAPAAALLPQMSLEWIYQYQKWFYKDHWQFIGKAHALNIDFDKLEKNQRQEIFITLFSPFGRPSVAAELLPQKPLEWMYQYQSWFFDDHWKQIGEAHILAFDILQIETSRRQKICGLLFSPYASYGTTSDAAKYLPRMSVKQKADLKPYLFEEAHQYLK